MKKIGKIAVWLVIVLVFMGIILLGYVKFGLPDVGQAADLKIESTAERLERGKYLANHVCLCMDCHSVRDWSKLSGPVDMNSFGAGGDRFDHNMGLPGIYYASNITPHGLKDWTDGEIYRAITNGVTKDNRALFPIMPYQHFMQMDPEDVYSIIAYIRTLPTKESEIKASESDFPMNFIINTIPQKMDIKIVKPSANDQIAYGRYLVNAASCSDCHSKMEKGKPVSGMDFAGGNEFKYPDGKTSNFSANITPDTETGIGLWTEEQFVNRFAAYREIKENPRAVSKGEFQTIMPWIMMSGMNDSDLKAIYAYLRTIKPVRNKVTPFVTAD
ncbi:c-type cytochrome [Pseudopedobacter saltans]|nr:c-type cytochrome [Pseudopedobacter saltans]